MADHTPTVRSLNLPHPDVRTCIVCGRPDPTIALIVMPDPAPAPHFRNYAASAHLDCFTRCPIVSPEDQF